MLLNKLLGSTPVILGSQSPRRKELLESLGIKFEVQVREIDETIPVGLAAKDAAEYLAKEKIRAFAEPAFYEQIVITADTVVVNAAAQVLGKPKDATEACQVLANLSGAAHQVYTGVAIAYRGQITSFSTETIVHFNKLDQEEISYYVAQYKPFDKAGAYGIQEWIGSMGIAHIEGSFNNVVGLPTSRLYAELKNILINKGLI